MGLGRCFAHAACLPTLLHHTGYTTVTVQVVVLQAQSSHLLVGVGGVGGLRPAGGGPSPSGGWAGTPGGPCCGPLFGLPPLHISAAALLAGSPVVRQAGRVNPSVVVCAVVPPTGSDHLGDSLGVLLPLWLHESSGNVSAECEGGIVVQT